MSTVLFFASTIAVNVWCGTGSYSLGAAAWLSVLFFVIVIRNKGDL